MRKAEYLHMSRAGDGADVRNEMVLDRCRNQGGEENHVRDALIDQGQSVIEILGDNDTFRDLRAKSLAQNVGLHSIGLHDQKPRHDAGSIMLRAQSRGCWQIWA
jgi:hypothetical protein